MEVTFDVRGRLFEIPEKQATTMAESLRLQGTEQLGSYGIEGSIPVADLIEDVLVGRFDEPIPLEGEAAEAVFYILNTDITMPTDPKLAAQYALYQAVSILHKERLARGE